MRVRFTKQNLLPNIAIAQSVASMQTTIPILSNVLITAAAGGRVTILATDYETRVRLELEGEVEKAGTCTIPGKMLFDIVRELPEDSEITIEALEKSVTLTTSGVNVDLAAMNAADFPKFPKVEELATVELEQKSFRRLLEKLLFAVPTRDPRKVLLGSLFQIRGGILTAVATDGKILACVKLETENTKGDAERDVIVPFKVLNELSHNLGDTGTVTLTMDDRSMSFAFGNKLYISNQIEGKYPNYEAVIPKSFSKSITFQKSAMSNAIRRAAILSDQRNRAVTLGFGEGNCVIEAESYDRGSIKESVPSQGVDKDFRILFNYAFLADVLKSVELEEVILKANQPTTPAVFQGNEANDFFYLVMPIKIAETRESEPSGADDDDEENDE